MPQPQAIASEELVSHATPGLLAECRSYFVEELSWDYPLSGLSANSRSSWMNKKACIIMPTYNEAANLAELLPQVFEQADKIPTHELHLLVVDDNSPDRTGSVVAEWMKHNPHLHLLSGSEGRPRRGLQAWYGPRPRNPSTGPDSTDGCRPAARSKSYPAICELNAVRLRPRHRFAICAWCG